MVRLSLIAVALAAPLAWAEQPVTPPAAVRPEKPESPYAALTGVIKEKKEQEILVKRDDAQGDVKVTLGDHVKITKGDRPATADDLSPGVKVELRVKTKDNRIEVVAIHILPDKATLPSP